MSCVAQVTDARRWVSSIFYHSQNIWLFTRSDLKTIVFPSTLFALAFAFVEGRNDTYTSKIERFFSSAFLLRVPWTLFWTWINLLPFTISNQRQPSSIEEDSQNKPWRPLPARRLTAACAASIMGLSYVLAIITSLSLGQGILQCISLIGLGIWYNDFGGGDDNFVIRNLINGAGYTCFLSGALEIQTQKPAIYSQPKTALWLMIICAVICTSIHAQDMSDQAGDRGRSRQTLPLVLGDAFARWHLAVSISWWSIVCPAFWELNLLACLATMVLGASISTRFLRWRTVYADQITFKIYNFWIMALFILPLLPSRNA